MRQPSSQCNEFMLLILCRIHCRHVIVYTQKRPWTSIDSDLALSPEDLHNICDLHLAYLGGHIYGEVCPHSMFTTKMGNFSHPLDIPAFKKMKGCQCKVLDLSPSACPKRKTKVIKKSCVTDLGKLEPRTEELTSGCLNLTGKTDQTADATNVEPLLNKPDEDTQHDCSHPSGTSLSKCASSGKPHA